MLTLTRSTGRQDKLEEAWAPRPPHRANLPVLLITRQHILSSERETFIYLEPLVFLLLSSSQTQIPAHKGKEKKELRRKSARKRGETPEESKSQKG